MCQAMYVCMHVCNALLAVYIVSCMQVEIVWIRNVWTYGCVAEVHIVPEKIAWQCKH